MGYMRRLKEFGDRLTFALMVAFAIIVTLETWQYISSLQSRHSSQAEFERVSLVQLLANPERYDGGKIQAAGLFLYNQEQHALFLNSEDVENGITQNSITVVLPSPTYKQGDLARLNGKFVSVKGIFRARGAAESAQRIPEIVAVEEVRSPPYADKSAVALHPAKTDGS